MQRKNIRLKGFDYTNAGYYFVTICTNNKQNILSEIRLKLASNDVPANSVRHKLELSHIGIIIDKAINKISSIYTDIAIDKYVIMPNHIHMIVVLRDAINRLTVSRIIKQFKGTVSKQLGIFIWHKSFYDHIIRNQQEYEKIWQYIEENPENWEDDCYYETTRFPRPDSNL